MGHQQHHGWVRYVVSLLVYRVIVSSAVSFRFVSFRFVSFRFIHVTFVIFVLLIRLSTAEQIELVLVANLVPTLVHLMKTAEFDIKKEACWALSNATSGGKPQHVQYLVEQGLLPALCDLFVCADPKIIKVALEAVDNILRTGKDMAEKMARSDNPWAAMVEECGGLDKLETLQQHESEDIYQKSQSLLTAYAP